MTRTKKSKPVENKGHAKAQSNAGGSEVRWVNPAPNAGDVEWLEGNTISALEDLINVFEALTSEQRLSCKFDSRTNRWIAVLFDNPMDGAGATPALSVRGASALDALLLLGYFVIRRFPNGWHNEDSASQGRFG